VELLVVIAVIGILAGLLLPALASAKSKAHTVGCLNNLRQDAIAGHLYTSDNGDLLVPNNPVTHGDSAKPMFATWAGNAAAYGLPDGTNDANLLGGYPGQSLCENNAGLQMPRRSIDDYPVWEEISEKSELCHEWVYRNDLASKYWIRGVLPHCFDPWSVVAGESPGNLDLD
jgi:hypothetical protein